MHQRTSIKEASESESDRYEELLVNPAILQLAKSRGDIDCGGLEFVIVRYGNFFQFVQPIKDGHVSIAIEKDANLDHTIEQIQDILGIEK